jgi:hypothetical protein
MRWLAGICTGAFLALQNTSCTKTPDYSKVVSNGPFAPDISIPDIVNQVKCELAVAIHKKKASTKRNLAWLDSWTAKADLTLQVNDTGSITPSIAFVEPLKNVFPTGLGSSNVLFSTGQVGPTSTVTAVSQSFNLGIGGGYSGQAYRTETLSFAVSLRELENWKYGSVGKEKTGETCRPAGGIEGTDLQGGLDLEKWVDAALLPVEAGELQLGDHPDPKAVSKAGGLTAQVYVPESDRKTTYSLDEAKQAYYKEAADNAAKEATKSAQQAWAAARQARLAKIRDPDVIDTIYDYARQAAKAAIFAQQAAKNANLPAPAANADNKADFYSDNATLADKNAETAAFYANAAKRAANPDPPIDSISHSLNFIVTTGATLSPNWLLLHWKGPANVGNLGTYSDVRTHTLSIALGSPAGGVGSEPNRLLNNQAIRQAIQSQ